MAATAQSLFDSAECVSCVYPLDTAQTLRIGLLLQIFESLGGDMTPQELIDESTCYICLPGVSLGDGIELGLLNQIAELVGGGSSSLTQVYSGSGDPVAAPNDPTKAALYYDTSGGTIWQWSIAGAAWA